MTMASLNSHADTLTRFDHILDLVCNVQHTSYSLLCLNIHPVLSDHNVVSAYFNIKPKVAQWKWQYMKLYLHRKADMASLKQDITKYDRSFFQVADRHPTDELWTNLKNTFNASTKRIHIPQKTITTAGTYLG